MTGTFGFHCYYFCRILLLYLPYLPPLLLIRKRFFLPPAQFNAILNLLNSSLKGGGTLENKGCKCKKGGHGHNYITSRITINLDGNEISNRDLVCRDCAYKKRGNTASCLRFDKKPDTVLGGGECKAYLKDGSDLMGKKGHSCGGCGNCC